MGLLVDGVWKDQWYDTKSNDGKFVRSESQFRKALSHDKDAEHPFEEGRYHLYVSLACPWAHRTLIFRKLKGLESAISLSTVHPHMLDQGWTFEEGEGVVPDPIHGARYMHQVYTAADPHYSGRVTVPVLWDKKKGTMVNNESSEIIRMFNDWHRGEDDLDFYPAELRQEIDQVNDRVYHNVNNGVYKAGFATTQKAYEEAVTALFDALDWLENRLSAKRYLCGDRLTEADWRLFTTLVRFDPVYVGHFKCNLRRIYDYPSLQGYLKELYQIPGIAETVNFQHIKQHYYYSHDTINPTRIVPVGPDQDLQSAHGRDRIIPRV